MESVEHKCVVCNVIVTIDKYFLYVCDINKSCGTYLASASSDKTVIIWEKEKLEGTNVPMLVTATTNATTTATTTATATTATTATMAATANATESRNGSEEEDKKENWTIKWKLEGHVLDVQDITWSPDDSLLASGSMDCKIIIWKLDNFAKSPPGFLFSLCRALYGETETFKYTYI
ncbi:hypothetical protein RFI_20259 [Reticulomyxa filosa]|uniref:Uncharacterized protein n=1 Tax=Reticulomyxa filosa TaxID=46433 RepID=X6MSW4_RETFI|nr:hypothetical protein RFI_20259 [Reticulomyxa filosa]|eukprot:ETO17073.1 hypothetical protein RFI_20259 [Reticulomyxa filosa]